MSPGPSGFAAPRLQRPAQPLRLPGRDGLGIHVTNRSSLARSSPLRPVPQASWSRPSPAGQETRLQGRYQTADNQPPQRAPTLTPSPVLLRGQSGAQRGTAPRRPGSPIPRSSGGPASPRPRPGASREASDTPAAARARFLARAGSRPRPLRRCSDLRLLSPLPPCGVRLKMAFPEGRWNYSNCSCAEGSRRPTLELLCPGASPTLHLG